MNERKHQVNISKYNFSVNKKNLQFMHLIDIYGNQGIKNDTPPANQSAQKIFNVKREFQVFFSSLNDEELYKISL